MALPKHWDKIGNFKDRNLKKTIQTPVTELDRIFAGIEARELQFLLKGKEREKYLDWLKKPKEFRDHVKLYYGH